MEKKLDRENLLREIENRIYSTRDQLAQTLDEPREEIDKALLALEQEREIAYSKQGKVALAATMGYFKGKIERKPGGFAFLRTREGMDDIFLGDRDQRGALNGEEVLVKLKRRQTEGKHLEGKVVEVLSGLPVTVVGTAHVQGKTVFVVCDGATADDVYIPQKAAKGVRDGQKVVVSVLKRAAGEKSPEGEITEILGNAGQAGVDILSYARRFGLQAEFSEPCRAQARRLVEAPFSEKGRVDLRGERIITIDGADAKDLDDAVSLTLLENGNYRLGVHIADVSHYVQENTPIDKEALLRGTSVYLVDRVVPMLPKELSNHLCSLNPDEDKYALSCLMEINARGDLVGHELASTVIRSSYRMTYADVNGILAGDARLNKKYAKIAEMLSRMDALAKTLRARRFEKGSIDFDLPEAKIVLDPKGRPVEIGVRERGDAEKLIEEFMLKCNVTVAEQFYFMEMPFLYRVHERPDRDRMKELAIFLRNFGIQLKGFMDVHPRAIQEVLARVEGTPDSNIVNSVTLRSLKKAKYDVMPIAHFGLAADQYCHFTSPIRRYPDLEVHRIVKMLLSGEMSGREMTHLERVLPEIARQSSERERNAIEAERAVQDLKMAEYMAERIGEQYEGVVSGVTRFGIFVELPNTVEGMIPLAQMKDDYYVYHEKQYCVIGERTKKKITLGDKTKIKVVAADISMGKIEFMFAE